MKPRFCLNGRFLHGRFGLYVETAISLKSLRHVYETLVKLYATSLHSGFTALNSVFLQIHMRRPTTRFRTAAAIDWSLLRAFFKWRAGGIVERNVSEDVGIPRSSSGGASGIVDADEWGPHPRPPKAASPGNSTMESLLNPPRNSWGNKGDQRSYQEDRGEASTACDWATRPFSQPSPAFPKRRHRRRKTLVLDLDETLIHSSCRSSANYDFHVEVLVEGQKHACLYFVYRRPGVEQFLNTVSSWYTLIVFTASLSPYADPVIDFLDRGRNIFARRYFRESCYVRNGQYLKPLRVVEQDGLGELASTVIVDNSPVSWSLNRENALPISSWVSDPNDTGLIDMLPMLDALRSVDDVRNILRLRI